MKRVIVYLFAGIIVAGVVIAQAETDISVSSMPPVVVETSPKSGDTAVDPFLKEIHVTFSKDMMTKSSRPGEFHPQSLTDPDVSLSTHPAPIAQPNKWPCPIRKIPPISG